MRVLPAHTCVYYVHAGCPRRPEEGIRSVEWKAQTVVICHMSAGNGTEVGDPQEEQPGLPTTVPPPRPQLAPSTGSLSTMLELKVKGQSWKESFSLAAM